MWTNDSMLSLLAGADIKEMKDKQCEFLVIVLSYISYTCTDTSSKSRMCIRTGFSKTGRT